MRTTPLDAATVHGVVGIGSYAPTPQHRELPHVNDQMSVAPARMLHTPLDVARITHLGRTTIFALLASGEIESVQIGRSRRIPHACLVEFVDRLRASTNAADDCAGAKQKNAASHPA